MKETKKVKLADYKEFPFQIPYIFLDLAINKSHVQVTATYQILKTNNSETSLILKGINIQTESIKINGYLLNQNEFQIYNDRLVINKINLKKFQLIIKCVINPFSNVSLEGL